MDIVFVFIQILPQYGCLVLIVIYAVFTPCHNYHQGRHALIILEGAQVGGWGDGG